MKRILTLTQVCAAALVVVLAGPSYASGVQSLSGIQFQAASPADAGCINRYREGGIQNNCSTTKTVIASIPHYGVGWYNTYVTAYGSSATACRSMTISDKGDVSYGGTFVALSSSLMNWQNVYLAYLPIYSGTNQSFTFECALQPGGIIGSLTLTW